MGIIQHKYRIYYRKKKEVEIKTAKMGTFFLLELKDPILKHPLAPMASPASPRA